MSVFDKKIIRISSKKKTTRDLLFDVPSDFIEFNNLIGLPKHPFTSHPMPMMPYQEEFLNLIPRDRNRIFHINKSRQIGMTELVLRVIAYHSFFKYKGGRVLIIAGTRVGTAAKMMARLKQLFWNISWAVSENHNKLSLKLANGTEIEALPSNSDAIRGYTQVRAIFVDEAAHFDLTDDSVVMDAIRPIVFTNRADLFLVSTPNGRRGFFYDIASSENEFHKIQRDYTSAIGWIYTKEEIEKELQRTDIDVDQEYRCQFTSPRNSVFGDRFTEDDYEDEAL